MRGFCFPLSALSDSLSHARTRSAQGQGAPTRPSRPTNGSARRFWGGSRAGHLSSGITVDRAIINPAPAGISTEPCVDGDSADLPLEFDLTCAEGLWRLPRRPRGASRRPSVRRSFPTSGRRVPLRRGSEETGSVDAGRARAGVGTARYNPGRQTIPDQGEGVDRHAASAWLN